MDVLSDVIRTAGIETILLTRNAFHERWGLAFPCAKSIGFHIVTQGECWIRTQGHAPVRLGKGDIALMARGYDHELASDSTVPAVPVELLKERIERAAQHREESTRAQPLTTIVCGAYRFSRQPLHPFFSELPRAYVIPAEQIPAHHPLHASLTLLSAELTEAQPAGSVVVTRLVDILFYYIFRHWVQTHVPGSGSAWTLALRDESLTRALTAMHGDMARDWTLDSLAREGGVSRAAFALRFKKVTGESPGHYLTRLRVERSAELLERSEKSLEQIAGLVGYSNSFAFSKAFKRVRGMSPREFRASYFEPR